MPITQEEALQIAQVTRTVVEEIIAARMEQVYLAIEQMREEFQMTVGVLDGNDHAVIGELQRMKGVTPAEVLEEAGRAWERFIKTEAGHLGLKVIRPKVEKMAVVEGD